MAHSYKSNLNQILDTERKCKDEIERAQLDK